MQRKGKRHKASRYGRRSSCESRINFAKGGAEKTWTKIERTGMHKFEEIEKVLNLLDTYDGQLSKTARA